MLGLAPSPERAATLDQGMRSGLADSLRQLLAVGAVGDSAPAVERAAGRLTAGPVSPWTFAHYAFMVRALSRHESLESQAVLMVEAIDGAIPPSALAFGDPLLSEESWAVTRDLYDTDAGRPFAPSPPGSEAFAAASGDLEAARALLRLADPVAAAEIESLIRTVILGVPPTGGEGFDGASTLFMWGAPIINARIHRDPATMVDLLVHESSHLILLGAAAGAPLAQNDPTATYASPLRADPRPIGGILHAAYVCTRVHLVMGRLLESSTSPDVVHPNLEARRDFNGQAAIDALAVLDQHLEPTPLGVEVMEVLQGYWSDGR